MVDIELCSVNEQDCLKFTFIDKLTEESALSGIEEWLSILSSSNTEKINIVWDTTKMSGFENKARKLWQGTLKELRYQIDCVCLITNSSAIKAGAKLMNTFTPFKLKVVKKLEDVSF